MWGGVGGVGMCGSVGVGVRDRVSQVKGVYSTIYIGFMPSKDKKV